MKTGCAATGGDERQEDDCEMKKMKKMRWVSLLPNEGDEEGRDFFFSFFSHNTRIPLSLYIYIT